MSKRTNLTENLKDFLKELEKDFDIDKFVLFGSMATGKNKETSDVDLIIVSNDFEGMNFFERASKVSDYWDLDLPVDFLCYTKKEFAILKNRISIASKALEEGVLIK